MSIASYDAAERLLDLVGPLRLPYCPCTPTVRQEAFLRLLVPEVFYGGAAGGGKSVALLMSAEMYVGVPGYHALIVRTTLGELERPGGLIELSHDWYAGTKAVWSGELRCWRFPGPGRAGSGGSGIWFGYLDGQKDVNRHSGASFSLLAFDELSAVDEVSYRRMHKVLRKPAGSLGTSADGLTLADVPLRTRATGNPGGRNHQWIKSYFVDPQTRPPGVVFIRSTWNDNPHLDRDSYLPNLEHLPPAERARLIDGDWEIPDDGEIFRRDWFEIIDRNAIPSGTAAVRYWDFAAKAPSLANPDPDYTVGLRLEVDKQSTFYISDIVRVRVHAGEVEQVVKATAEADGRDVTIVLEQEPGAAGVHLMSHYKRNVLRGYAVYSDRVGTDKETRARIVVAAAADGRVKLTAGRNHREFLDEVAAFPNAAHDDCVDALSGAHKYLDKHPPRRTYRSSFPRGNIGTGIQRPRSAAQARAQIEQQDRETQTLAAQIGIPYAPRI